MRKTTHNILPVTIVLGVLLAVSVGFNIFFFVKSNSVPTPHSYPVSPDYSKQAEQQAKNKQAYIKGWSYKFRNYGKDSSGTTGTYYSQLYNQGYEYGKEYEDALTAFITGYYDGDSYVSGGKKNIKELVADCKANSNCLEQFTKAYNLYFDE